MVPFFLDFHENIRLSKTLREYQEKPYPLEKTTIVFLDPPKNIHGTAREFSNIQYCWDIILEYSPEFHCEFFQIYWEYLKGMFHEYICPLGNGLVRKVTSFVKSSMFDVWHGSISLQFLKNLKVSRLINIECQHKSNSVTEGYALFINMDHKHGLYSIFQVWTIK